jgi:hypothetical protein
MPAPPQPPVERIDDNGSVHYVYHRPYTQKNGSIVWHKMTRKHKLSDSTKRRRILKRIQALSLAQLEALPLPQLADA